MYDNVQLCKKCGGECCKKAPCHYSPDDFIDLSFKGLKSEIEKGFISIDWWCGDADTNANELDQTFFLRVKTAYGCITDPTFGGPCILLDKNKGCPLDSDHRPKGGRMLIPDKEKCKQTYSKQQCALDWRPYNNTLFELYKYFYDFDPMESVDRMMGYLKSEYNMPER